MSTVADFLEALDGLVITQQDYYRCMEAVQIVHDGRVQGWRRAELAARTNDAVDWSASVISALPNEAMADRNASIRALIQGGMTTRAVAKRYGISAPQVSRIARGLSGR